MTRWLVLFGMLCLAGCEASTGGGPAEGSSCNGATQCPVGLTCDPFRRVCVAPPDVGDPPADGSVTADVSQDTATEAPKCLEATPCDDGDPCTRGDSCKGGVCAGAPYTCDDGFDCTLDRCDGAGACTYVMAAGKCLIDGQCRDAGSRRPANPCQACLPSIAPLAWSNDDGGDCDDKDACTAPQQCAGGACVGGHAVVSDDGVACTVDACDPATGCTVTPSDALCDDGVACTVDACDPASGCTHTPDTGACDDMDACTTDECLPAGCAHTPIPGCPPPTP